MKEFFIDTTRMTDEELADVISELKVELAKRKNKIEGANWLDRQLKINALEVRSWSPQERRNMRNAI